MKAECTVIQHLLSLPQCREPVFDRLRSEDFFDRSARACFESIHRVWSTPGMDVDGDDVQDSFYSSKAFGAVLKRADVMPWPDAMAQVETDAVRRRVARAGQQLIAISDDATATVESIRDAATAVATAAEDMRSTVAPPTIAECCAKLRLDVKAAARGERTSVPWGLAELAEMIPRHGGTIHVVGARPAVGKTAHLVSDTRLLLARKVPLGIFCFEMSASQVLARYASQLCERSTNDILSANFRGEDDVKAYAAAVEDIEAWPLGIDCGHRRTVQQIRDIARQWQRDLGIRALYIDYAQNIRHVEKRTVREAVMDSLNGIKDLAQDMDVPVVIYAQLNRSAEGEPPRLSHLKESGLFEEIAESIILLDRPDADPEGSKPRNYTVKGVEQCMQQAIAGLVAKHRNGPPGVCIWEYVGELMELRPLAPSSRYADQPIPGGI